jgi:endonuclease/exonuclease/phosphatase family metal-dependent hydrolase
VHNDPDLSLRREQLSSGRRVARFVDLVSTALILVALTATVTAQIVRDRMLGLALLMFVPIWPLAMSAIVRDVLARGRALPLRWFLLTLGVGASAFSVSLMWSRACVPEGNAESPQVTIVHWNMQWGGARGPVSLAEMIGTLEAYQPDVVCLSEAPTDVQLQRGSGAVTASRWHAASVEHSPPSAYWFRLTVLSRQPVTVRQQWDLRTGHAALFEVALRPRTLRILMVDLQSDPFLPRSPAIAEIARMVDDLAAADAPVDVVAGDFNTPGRFIGFDALSDAANGYRRAAMWSGQWRATWPARLSLLSLDIDHLWVKRGLNVASAHLFSSPNTDHRGQVAVLRLP